MRNYLTILTLLAALLLAPLTTHAQEDESNGFIVDMIQDSLSSDNQKIRLNGIDGLLASDAKVEEITIADRDGIWLTIRDADIVWTRRSLFAGRLKIDSLKAASIEILRKPLADESLPTLEAEPFSLPELPVSVEIGEIEVAKLTLGEPVFGQAAELSLKGAVTLIDGSLDSKLDIQRLDGVDARLEMEASFQKTNSLLVVDLNLKEAQGGLISTLLKMEGAPALDVTVKGNGPLDALDLTLLAAADGKPAINGDLKLREARGGLGFDAKLNGQIAPLIASPYRPFFFGQSRISATGQTHDAGGLTLNALNIDTAAMKIEGDLATTPDGFPRQIRITGTLGDGVTPTTLPFGQDITLKRADLDVDFGTSSDTAWKASIIGDSLTAGGIDAQAFALRLSGEAENIADPQNRRLSINAIGDMNGIKAETRDLTRALGQRLSLQLASSYADGKYIINRARLGGNAAKLELEGIVDELRFTGDMTAQIARLAPYGGMLGRDLRGAVDLSLSGTIAPLDGGFDLTVDGETQALKLDIASLDPLLAGDTEVTGQITRDQTGIRTRGFKLSNDQIEITSDGAIATDNADFQFDALLRDLREVTTQASGPLKLTGSITGKDGQFDLNTAISTPAAELLGKPLQAASATFIGTVKDNTLTGRLAGNGRLDSAQISLFADVAAAADTQSAKDIRFTVGPTRLTGDIRRGKSGLIDGTLDLRSPDISLPATFFLQEATGRANASLQFAANPLGQQVIAAADLADVVVAGISLGRGNLDAHVENALGVPTIAGALNFQNAIAGGIEITNGILSAGGRDRRTDFTTKLELSNATTLNGTGALTATDIGYEIELYRFDVDHDGPLASLSKPAALRVSGDKIDIETLALQVGDGTLTAQGAVEDKIDLSFALQSVPLNIANAFLTDLGLTGTVTGDATVTGARADPKIAFDIAALGLTTAALEAAALPAFDISTNGTTEDDLLEISAKIAGPQSFDSEIAGTVALSTQEMKLAGTLNSFPLAIIDAVSGKQGLRGNVSGSFNLLDTPTKPRLNFKMSGTGISAAVMRDNAIPALGFTAEGSFVNDTINLPVTRITGADGTNFTVSGRIPLRLDGLNMAANGQIPLSIANVAFAKSGLSASGTTAVSLRATGRLGAPNLSGTATMRNGTFVSSQANLRLENASIDANFAGNKINLTNASARNSNGGDIAVNGAITLDTTLGLPIDLTAKITNLRYTDGKLATAEASGDLSLTGAIMRQSLISGQVLLKTLEILIPQQLGAKRAYRLDVKHINTPQSVQQTLKRAGLTETPEPQVKTDSDISFDVDVLAPNRVFVRGRGVDAELGGTLKLRGSTSNLRPSGQFDLIRGRISVLAQRIELDEGFIRMTGTTDPEISMRARTVTDDVEARVVLEGPASKPILSFSSVPDLPDDEILARLVFDRSLSDLSALQVAQLAAAAGELSGRTGPSFFSQLRDATGLDDLDFQTDNRGTTTVRVGKYIQENIYSSIEADNRGSSRATINLDINPRVTAKGTLDNEGNTSFGIFYEKDY